MKHNNYILFCCLLACVVALSLPSSAAYLNHSFLDGSYEVGQDVTAECISCHSEQATDMLNSTHWLWTTCAECGCEEEKFQGEGKRTVINNFCVAVASNEPRCTSCHTGYGWEDNTFDFTNESNIDCVVCHETTGTYKKIPTAAGAVDPSVDLAAVAQSVGSPTRDTCGGNCHFYGGGGDNVKHGDMSSALLDPSRELDVHMGGMDFQCQNCHKTTAHNVAGRFAGVPGSECRVLCSDCHGDTPHQGEYKDRINDHSDSIACQTCHIPAFAREVPTKMYWDWSKAGQDIDNIPTDEYGQATYNMMKGEFVWGMNVTPTYTWFNGSFDKYFLGDEVASEGVTVLSAPLGDRYDVNSKIYPFKIHLAKQISDAKYNYLIIPDLFGGEDSYWASYDWDRASRAGMDYVDMPYSGQYEFVETSLYESINHEVAPKEDALGCIDCHLDGGKMDFAALGYEGDPMIFGERAISGKELKEIESMGTTSEYAESGSVESSPGFEFFVGLFGLLAAVIIKKRK
ncbi:tetrathionate reductase family octaheme c-type cytochrome [Methanolobus psychrotolerans]|uniref:tetrathionate reductase family octaheme c-type cytochrome n=1 Tax=Methanolobus psychrotolerans TaxID=1874706 RepID=UPI000B915619|nr:tetrathionate reductase family octaheme c-type cytochrome [Methanolobus psychrotolerans]